MKKRCIVFVCTGNICRSPMAEYALKDQLGAHSDWHVLSAGLAAGIGQPPSRNGCSAMKELGIDMGLHKSRPLDGELVDLASIIVVMTSAHAEQIKALFPGAEEKVFLLKTFTSDETDGCMDVDDPIGGNLIVYRKSRDEIVSCISGLVAFMNCLE